MARRPSSVRLSVRPYVCLCKLLRKSLLLAGKWPICRIATKLANDGLQVTCIQDVLKVKVKGHVIRALFSILGMSYSVIDGLVLLFICCLFLMNKC